MGIAAAKQCPFMCVSLIVVTRRRSASPKVQRHNGVVAGQARSAACGPHGPARGMVYTSLKKPCPHIMMLLPAPPRPTGMRCTRTARAPSRLDPA